jgi:serine/threonine-protein kinase RsbW
MSEIVKVDIPAKAEHLLVVRLAASGICSRLGMGIEQMEDVKAAVAEACLIMIHDRAGYRRLTVAFEYSDSLWVTVGGCEPGGEANDDEIDADFSLALLEALTDKTTVGDGAVRFKARGGSKR